MLYRTTSPASIGAASRMPAPTSRSCAATSTISSTGPKTLPARPPNPRWSVDMPLAAIQPTSTYRERVPALYDPSYARDYPELYLTAWPAKHALNLQVL